MPATPIRKGAKSCLECRLRKVRCVWPPGGSERCQSCLARGRTCDLQVNMIPASETIKGTSRARLGHLESDVAGLWAAVRNLEAKFGNVSTEADPFLQSPSPTEDPGGPYNTPNDEDSESTAADLSLTDPPTHILQLLDNGLLDSSGDGSTFPSHHATSLHKAQRSSPLRALLPSRMDILTITAPASSCLSLYNELFPVNRFAKTAEEMLSQYDKLQDLNADPVAIAALLLSMALIVQQAPDDAVGRPEVSIRDASLFIKDVSDCVERIVISDDILAGTLEGMEMTLLFIRLQLGRASLRKIWLLLRRVIALAELIGLPRASTALNSNQGSLAGSSHGTQAGAPPSLIEQWQQKAVVWESICAVDRMASMMWSLPLATVAYPLPKPPIVDSQGQVCPQAYLYGLAEIASRILELDNIYSSGRPLLELSKAVIGTDHQLRSLASLTPQSWQRTHWPQLSVDALLQYWHQYLTVRTHLQLALKYQENQEFAFNFAICLDACQELARRYVSMRPILPAGFFANRLIDLQAFTATVFLLLASYCNIPDSSTLSQAADVKVVTGIVDQASRMMDFAAKQVGGDFAHQAADAVRSLSSLLQQPQSFKLQKVTLSLPLVGRIHVSRKSHGAAGFGREQPYTIPGQEAHGVWRTPTSGDVPHPTSAMPFASLDVDPTDSLDFSMEVPDNHAFLTDETYESEPWLTCMEWNSKG